MAGAVTRQGRIGRSDVGATVRIHRAVEELLRNLPKEIAVQIERSAMKKALEPIQQQAVSNAPVGSRVNKKWEEEGRASGDLANSIKLGTKKDSNLKITGRVYSRQAYAHLVELGFAHWKNKRKVSGRFFLTRAYEAHKDKAEKILIEEIANEIEKRVTKASRAAA